MKRRLRMLIGFCHGLPPFLAQAMLVNLQEMLVAEVVIKNLSQPYNFGPSLFYIEYKGAWPEGCAALKPFLERMSNLMPGRSFNELWINPGVLTIEWELLTDFLIKQEKDRRILTAGHKCGAALGELAVGDHFVETEGNSEWVVVGKTTPDVAVACVKLDDPKLQVICPLPPSTRVLRIIR